MIFETDPSEVAAFSKRADAILAKRIAATSGRVSKVLGQGGPFTPAFKKTIQNNHQNILSNPFLVSDLRGHKRVLNALKDNANYPPAQELLLELQKKPTRKKGRSILCPVFRHERYLEITYASWMRYFFPEVFNQLFFVTIIFDFASNLYELENKIDEARGVLDDARRAMSDENHGLMLFGSFEPDLRSDSQIRVSSDLTKAKKQLDWLVPDTGGWVLSAHLVGRAVHKAEFKKILEERLPSNGWTRVLFKSLLRSKTILANLIDTQAYAGKYPEAVFPKGTTKGKGKADHDREMNRFQTAFLGPSSPEKQLSHRFDQTHAIMNWALFMDRLGPEKIYYTVENAYAQKWLSQSETLYHIKAGDLDWLHGYHRTEVHRDLGPYLIEVDPKLKHLIKFRRSRKLSVDEEWYDATDVSHLNPTTDPITMIL